MNSQGGPEQLLCMPTSETILSQDDFTCGHREESKWLTHNNIFSAIVPLILFLHCSFLWGFFYLPFPPEEPKTETSDRGMSMHIWNKYNPPAEEK